MRRVSLPFGPPIVPLALAALAGGCGGDDETIPLAINRFEVSATNVDAGQAVTLTWDVQGAAGVAIRQSPGRQLLTAGGPTGELTSDPLNLATTFTLTATAASGEVQTDSVNVSVTGINIVRFEATPSSIERGESTTLSWQLGGSPPSEVVLVNSQGDNVIAPSTMRNGSTTVEPLRTETYTLRAQAGGVQAEASATVEVRANPPTIGLFEARATVNGQPQVVTTVARGRQIQLFWMVSNVEEVKVTANGAIRRDWNTLGAASGNVSVVADLESNTYLLEAHNDPDAAGNPNVEPAPATVSSMELVVTTAELPAIDTFEVTPLAYTQGSTLATVTWSTSRADATRLFVDDRDDPSFPRTPSGTYSFDVSGEASLRLSAINAVGNVVETRTIALGYDEAEPNDDAPTAIRLPGDANPVRGTLTDGTDEDWYALDVGAGEGVFARVEVPSGVTCAELGVELALLDANGTVLGSRDQGPASACVEILGPEFAGFALDLAAGTYYLRLQSSSTGGRYSLEARPLVPASPPPNVTVQPQGDPPWEVTDVVQLSVLFGDEMSGFAELSESVTGIVGTRHRLEGFSGGLDIGGINPTMVLSNVVPAQTPYRNELQTMVSARGYANAGSFSVGEYESPNGIIFGLTVVPADTATVAASFDYPSPPFRPVIPNDRLPLSTQLRLGFGGTEFAVGTPVTVTADPGTAGKSHVHLLFALTGTLLPPEAPTPPGSFSWSVSVVDNSNEGYQVTVPFLVQ